MGENKLTFICSSYEVDGELTGGCDPFYYVEGEEPRAVTPEEMG